MLATLHGWQVRKPAEPMVPLERCIDDLADDDVLVRVAGCGVCHTDLGFFYEGIPTVKPYPLILGHEISGIVEHTGVRYTALKGKAVIVPAVLPCGTCPACEAGYFRICRRQKMPGNHIDGGFASHVVVPGRFLCPVAVESEDESFGESGVTLRELSVIADAVTTPYQAIKNAQLQPGELAVFIGTGGIGGFGVQLAKALGTTVVAIDIDQRRLELLKKYGTDAIFNPTQMDSKAIRQALKQLASERDIPFFALKIFETSGTAQGQELAFSLLSFGATLCVVGFTMEKVTLRLSNLMAYDARAIGNWGCAPDLYPEVLELVRTGKVQLAPFVERFPLSEINTVFEKVHNREIDRRPVLIPELA